MGPLCSVPAADGSIDANHLWYHDYIYGPPYSGSLPYEAKKFSPNFNLHEYFGTSASAYLWTMERVGVHGSSLEVTQLSLGLSSASNDMPYQSRLKGRITVPICTDLECDYEMMYHCGQRIPDDNESNRYTSDDPDVISGLAVEVTLAPKSRFIADASAIHYASLEKDWLASAKSRGRDVLCVPGRSCFESCKDACTRQPDCAYFTYIYEKFSEYGFDYSNVYPQKCWLYLNGLGQDDPKNQLWWKTGVFNYTTRTWDETWRGIAQGQYLYGTWPFPGESIDECPFQSWLKEKDRDSKKFDPVINGRCCYRKIRRRQTSQIQCTTTNKFEVQPAPSALEVPTFRMQPANVAGNKFEGYDPSVRGSAVISECGPGPLFPRTNVVGNKGTLRKGLAAYKYLNLHECDCPEYGTRDTDCCTRSFMERPNTYRSKNGTGIAVNVFDIPEYLPLKDFQVPHSFGEACSKSYYIGADAPVGRRESCAFVRRVEFNFEQREAFRISSCRRTFDCFDYSNAETCASDPKCVWTRGDSEFGELVQPGFYNVSQTRFVNATGDRVRLSQIQIWQGGKFVELRNVRSHYSITFCDPASPKSSACSTRDVSGTQPGESYVTSSWVGSSSTNWNCGTDSLSECPAQVEEKEGQQANPSMLFVCKPATSDFNICETVFAQDSCVAIAGCTWITDWLYRDAFYDLRVQCITTKKASTKEYFTGESCPFTHQFVTDGSFERSLNLDWEAKIMDEQASRAQKSTYSGYDNSYRAKTTCQMFSSCSWNAVTKECSSMRSRLENAFGECMNADIPKNCRALDGCIWNVDLKHCEPGRKCRVSALFEGSAGMLSNCTAVNGSVPSGGGEALVEPGDVCEQSCDADQLSASLVPGLKKQRRKCQSQGPTLNPLWVSVVGGEQQNGGTVGGAATSSNSTTGDDETSSTTSSNLVCAIQPTTCLFSFDAHARNGLVFSPAKSDNISAAGWFMNRARAFSKTDAAVPCEPCPIGFYSPIEGLLECTKCKPGFYAASEGQSECLPTTCLFSLDAHVRNGLVFSPAKSGNISAPGWFMNRARALETDAAVPCEPCPVGFYSPLEGLLECTKCKPGFYAASEGQSECLPTTCLFSLDAHVRNGLVFSPAKSGNISAPGWFMNRARALETDAAVPCEPCPVGFYSPLEGLLECTKCKPGFYAASEGQSECPPTARSSSK